MTDPTNNLTVAEVAARRGVAIVTVNAWIHHATNPLAAIRRGYQWYIDPADLDAYQPRSKGKPKGSKQTA